MNLPMYRGKCIGGTYDGEMMSHPNKYCVVPIRPKVSKYAPVGPADDTSTITVEYGAYRFDGKFWKWGATE